MVRPWQWRAGSPPAEPGTWAAEMTELLAQVRDSTFTLILPLFGAVLALVIIGAYFVFWGILSIILGYSIRCA